MSTMARWRWAESQSAIVLVWLLPLSVMTAPSEEGFCVWAWVRKIARIISRSFTITAPYWPAVGKTERTSIIGYWDSTFFE